MEVLQRVKEIIDRLLISTISFIEIIDSGTIITLTASLLGVILGGIITWIIARRYYIRASNDLKKEASELRRYNELILRGMENAKWVKLNRDKEGKIIGFVFEEHTKINIRSETSSADLVVKNEGND